MKLGSLFDGSGTAPLAASMCGIEPVWASEIEPYPIKVTKARFPNMLHLGDITKIDGSTVEPVDIICGGSPCQDLSVAGKQKGLQDGERSHLFFEMTRIIKQMRETTNGKYPRYIIWENVPGAFSSNKGHDFLAVLQAFAEIADPDIYVPEPKQKAPGKGLAWKYAGFVAGDGWSIAWRTVDAQYWGVPQRRRRIYLVADFAGECADQILFECTGVSGDSEPGREAREETAEDAGRSIEGSGRTVWPEIARTLTAEHDASPCIDRGQNVVFSVQGNCIDRNAAQNGTGVSENIAHTINAVDRHGVVASVDCRNMVLNDELSGTLQTKDNGGYSLNYQNPVVYSSGSYGMLSEGVGCLGTGTRATAEMVAVFDARGNENGKLVPTLTGDHQNRVTDYTALCVGNGQLHQMSMAEQANCLDCMHDQQAVVYPGVGITSKQNASNPQPGDPAPTISTDSRNYLVKSDKPPRKYIVRRLTPLECCRLQGFPDWWEDGVESSDSARYKMWGNGMALPNMLHVMRGIARMEEQS